MAYWLVRNEDLCPDDGAQCPDAAEYVSFDSTERYVEQCDGCPVIRLRDALERSAAGKLLRPVLDLDYKLQAGIQVPDSAIDSEQLQLLKLIRSERAARENQLLKRNQEGQ